MSLEKVFIDEKQLVERVIAKMKEEGVVHVPISYCGALNQELVDQFTEVVENLMISTGEKKTIVKRGFSILIEGLQNSLIHGELVDDAKSVLLVVADNDKYWKITIGNLTDSNKKEKLSNFVNTINGESDDEVKERYNTTLNNGLMSEKGGAGLGFITMRMKSKNCLAYSFTEVTPTLDYFIITATLNKEAS